MIKNIKDMKLYPVIYHDYKLIPAIPLASRKMTDEKLWFRKLYIHINSSGHYSEVKDKHSGTIMSNEENLWEEISRQYNIDKNNFNY